MLGSRALWPETFFGTNEVATGVEVRFRGLVVSCTGVESDTSISKHEPSLSDLFGCTQAADGVLGVEIWDAGVLRGRGCTFGEAKGVDLFERGDFCDFRSIATWIFCSIEPEGGLEMLGKQANIMHRIAHKSTRCERQDLQRTYDFLLRLRVKAARSSKFAL